METAIFAGDDDLTRRFRLLFELLRRQGNFVLFEDLLGLSGVLFRTYWHIRSGDNEPPRWSSRSASVCSGDPYQRAARATGVRLVDPDRAGEEGWRLEGADHPNTIDIRIESLRRSMEAGIAFTEEREFRDAGIFAAGHAAYDALAADLVAPASRFAPHTPEEAVRLVPEFARLELASWDALPSLAPIAALRTTLIALAEARWRLVVYLDRAGNFIAASGGLGQFQREQRALARAVKLLPDPARLARDEGGFLRKAAEDFIADRAAWRGIAREIGRARNAHAAGLRILRADLM